MKFANAILRPGIVEQVLVDGQIKASAPGLFSAQDLDKLPPIYPFFGGHANTYSEPVIGDEVWILNVLDNNRQLYWFRKDSFDDANGGLMQGGNVEVLCNREFGGGLWATIYFSDGSGWVIKRDDSKIQIDPDGNIILDTGIPYRCIDVNISGISLGSRGESSHPAAYGDKIEDALLYIYTALEAIQLAADTNPYTKGISMALQAQLPKIEQTIPQVSSPNVTLE